MLLFFFLQSDLESKAGRSVPCNSKVEEASSLSTRVIRIMAGGPIIPAGIPEVVKSTFAILRGKGLDNWQALSKFYIRQYLTSQGSAADGLQSCFQGIKDTVVV
jgi:hypothetical protein